MGSSTWFFGIRALPFPIEDKACSVLLWISDGAPVNVELVPSDEVDDAKIEATYQEAIRKPAGERPPGPPRKIVVAGGPLAKTVRAFARGVRVEVGPTLEIDLAFADLVEHLSGPSAHDQQAFLETPDDWKPALLALGEALADTEPWDLFPPDQPLRIDAPALQLADARLLVMGQGGESFGILLFRSAEDHATFDALARDGALAANAAVPRCVGIDVAELGLDDEAPRSVAIVTVLEGDGPREVTNDERRLAVAVGQALVELVARHEPALERAAEDDAPLPRIEGRHVVDVLGESIEVRLATLGGERAQA